MLTLQISFMNNTKPDKVITTYTQVKGWEEYGERKREILKDALFCACLGEDKDINAFKEAGFNSYQVAICDNKLFDIDEHINCKYIDYIS